MEIEPPTSAFAFVAAMYLKQEAAAPVATNAAPPVETAPTPTPTPTPTPVPEPQPIVTEQPCSARYTTQLRRPRLNPRARSDGD